MSDSCKEKGNKDFQEQINNKLDFIIEKLQELDPNTLAQVGSNYKVIENISHLEKSTLKKK